MRQLMRKDQGKDLHHEYQELNYVVKNWNVGQIGFSKVWLYAVIWKRFLHNRNHYGWEGAEMINNGVWFQKYLARIQNSER